MVCLTSAQNDLFARGINRSFDDRFLFALWKLGTNFRAEILVSRPVFKVKDDAPNKICGEAAKQYDDKFGQARPERRGSRLERCFTDRVAGGESVSKTGAHDAGEGRHQHSFGEVELRD